MQRRNIEVVLSPLLLPLVDLTGKTVVVIDILRATSTICAALHNGAKSVRPVISTEDALTHVGRNTMVAGERNGEKVDGFDFGNSPTEYAPDMVAGKKVVLTTTNGTKCIHASMAAREIMVGSFFNLDVLVDYLSTCPNDVVLFCSGWKNRVNLEDTLFAGYVAHSLKDSHDWNGDEVELAMDLMFKAQADPLDYLTKASHAQRFTRLGNHEDLDICMQFNKYPALVKYTDGVLINMA